jgi:LydA holin phage, holin superfamily III
MIEKDPTAWSAATWLLALGMAVGGGAVNWYAKIKQGHTRAFNIIELIGEIFTSGFVGLGVFMVLVSFEQPVGICAAAAGVGGHMATRLLFAVERAIEARIVKSMEKATNENPSNP